MILSIKYFGIEDIKHAKLTASKIAEYDPEEGRMLLEELNKL